MSLKDDLIAARALIDTPEKWIKGIRHTTERQWLFFERHRYCAVGAISTGQDGCLDHRPFREFLRLQDALEAALPPDFSRSYIWAFNDHPATTHNDVLALFDRAIEAAS
jgi:hypothetical protein